MAGEHTGAVLEYGVSLIESGFARSAPMPTEAIQIETHSGSVKKTSVCRLRVLPDHLALIVVRTGTVLAWNDSAHEWIVLPPNSLAYATGPVNIVLHLAKGEPLRVRHRTLVHDGAWTVDQIDQVRAAITTD